MGLRLGTRSGAGAAAALWWAEAGWGGSRERTCGGGAHGPGAGREAGPRRGLAARILQRRLEALRRVFLTRPGTGEAELGRGEDPDSYLRKSASISRAALLATGDNSSVETQTEMLGSSPEQECQAGNKAEAPKGQEQSLLETPLDPKEDAPCPTCSSSSESEPEGFFLGQRLPRPWETPRSLQAGDSDTSRKHCTIC